MRRCRRLILTGMLLWAAVLPEAGTAWAAKARHHHAGAAHAPVHAARHAHKTRSARHPAVARKRAPRHRKPHPTATAARSGHAATTVRQRPAKHNRSRKNSTALPLIVIDPGHGGRDPGAIGVSGTMEKTIALAAAIELRRALEATGRYRVALTRTADRTVSLADRLRFARKRDADLLIAIHADASSNHDARGASVYVSSRGTTTRLPAGSGNAGRIARAVSSDEVEPQPGSAWLQSTMIEQLDDDVRMVVAPARAAHLYVLGARTLPSVLLEMGFLSNRRDEALLRQPAHRRVLVQAIRDAIDDYFAAIRTSSSRT
jgi:N-acetylmuramoyl-L-alanine amidase